MCLPYLKITIIHKSSQYQRWELNPHEHTLNRFSYHYGFHHLHSLWSGLYLHHIFQFRCSPSSLYTFLFKGFARYYHFTGFTEFEEFYSKGFPMGTQIILKSVMSTIPSLRHFKIYFTNIRIIFQLS